MANDCYREHLFKEPGQQLWLPVQDTVASFFPKELRPDQSVNLYVMLLGGCFKDDVITWGVHRQRIQSWARSENLVTRRPMAWLSEASE